jgi:large subunit ribosomal protein L15
MMTLNNLQSPKGANRATKRIGRGQGSGQGTQAGKGHKGQKARKSGHVRTGFEGNNLPLYMRLPKRGFNNTVFAVKYSVVTLDQIVAKYKSGDTVNRESLVALGVLNGADKNNDLKIIGNAELKVSLTFEGIAKFSTASKELILKASGKIV